MYFYVKNKFLFGLGIFLLTSSFIGLFFIIRYPTEIDKMYDQYKNRTDYFLEDIDNYIKDNNITNIEISEIIDKNIPTDIQNDLNYYLIKLPDVHSLLKASNWKIYTTTEDLNAIYFDGAYSYVNGITRYYQKEIYLTEHIYQDKYIFQETVLHEIGHAIDCELSITETKEWENIYIEEKEKANFMREYGKSNIKEYFAESFYHYLTNQKKLKKYCPKTYQYIDEINSIL